MRVLLCDDHESAEAALDAISRRSRAYGGDEIVSVGRTPTAQEALRSAGLVRFDIALIDLYLPVAPTKGPAPPAGPWLARAIRRAHPDLQAPLVMWSANVMSTLEGRNQCRAFRHQGGQHIIEKAQPEAAQLKTLESALAGVTWEPPADGLTEIEREVLSYYAAGCSNQQIADATHRGIKAIESHIAAIRMKLLPLPVPKSIGRGAAPVVAAAAADPNISWLPVAHRSGPPDGFAAIDRG